MTPQTPSIEGNRSTLTGMGVLAVTQLGLGQTGRVASAGQSEQDPVGEQGKEQRRPWIGRRLVSLLNLGDLPGLRREPGFWGGLIVRAAALLGFLLFLGVGGDINDMVELLFEGMVNMLQGVCPYGQTYTLATFGGSYQQDYFNYPPLAILLHLPVLLWPGPQSLGTLDFMPAFTLLHTFFDFIMFYRLHQEGYRRAKLLIWVNPGMVFVDVITFLSLPMLLLTLALLNLDDPIRSCLYGAMLAATYQLGLIFIPFLLAYHYHRQLLIPALAGMLPVFAVTLPFLLWNPSAFINDLFLAQLGRGYVNWFEASPASPYYNPYYPATFLFMGSLPAVIFNAAILLGLPPDLAPRTALPMMLGVAVLALLLFIHFLRHPRKGLAILYPGTILALLIGSTATGLAHYWVLTVPLTYLAWAQRDTFRAPSD